MIKNNDTGKCLDRNSGGNLYATKACSSGNNFQLWQILKPATGIIMFKNRATGRCVDSNANGSAYTNPCSTANNYQKWR